MPEPKRGAVRKTAPLRNIVTGRPAERTGTPSAGRIGALLVGQGHGFIRLDNGREVFFHRSDMRDGAMFNKLAVGDPVSFELLDDHVSGPRALRVAPRQDR